MLSLITYHGTIVCRSRAGEGLVQCAIGDDNPVDSLFDADDLLTSMPGCTFVLLQGARPGTIHLRQNDRYLCAEPNVPALVADRPSPSIWETFLPLDVESLAALRLLLQQGWAALDVLSTPALAVQILPSFLLQVGETRIDLVDRRLTVDRVRIGPAGPQGEGLILTRHATLPASASREPALFGQPIGPELALSQAPPSHRNLPPVDAAGFLAHHECRLSLAGSPDVMRPPLFVSDADRRFFFECHAHGAQPAVGPQTATSEVRRATDKYILLQRYCEGILFDEAGTYSEAGYFNTLLHFPDGMRRLGDTVMLERRVLDSAEHLPGRYALMFNPHLSNYYHWIVEAMLSLDAIRAHLPPGTTLLLPGAPAQFRAGGGPGFDHRRIIELLGFGDLDIKEVAAPLCRVDEVVWLENYLVNQVPGAVMRAFRDRILHRLGRGQRPTRRIYIQRQGARRVADAAGMAAFCATHGFETHCLEAVDDGDQIAMFQEATTIIAPHGAGLSNLLFCNSGSRVIELSPDCEFRPFFWQIAEKVGLTYTVLACPTEDATFQGNLIVDLDKLALALATIEAMPPAQEKTLG